jgi:DNA-binding MarR family transcriptional regulator
MTTPKEIIVVNGVTGEVYKPQPKKIKRSEAFYMTIQTDSIILAKKKLTGMEHSVLLYLQGLADYDNVAQTSQVFLAEQLDTTEATISNCLKKLAEKGLIQKEKIRGQFLFKINQSVSTRGKVKK